MDELDDDELLRMEAEMEKSLLELDKKTKIKSIEMETIEIDKSKDEILIQSSNFQDNVNYMGREVILKNPLEIGLPPNLKNSRGVILKSYDTYFKVSLNNYGAIDIQKEYVELLSNDLINKLEESFLEQKQIYENILEDIFPERWDVWTNNSSIDYVIHFPEIKITNSNKKNHLIRDIYVILPFHKIGYNLLSRNRRTYAFRGTVTIDEHMSRYLYSHIQAGHIENLFNSNNTISYAEMCLGNGQPLGSEFAVLMNEYNPDKFLSTCLQLESFLSWESLEGGPYIKFESISKNSEKLTEINPYTTSSFTNIYLLLGYINILEFDNLGNGNLKIKKDSLIKLLDKLDSENMYKSPKVLYSPSTEKYYRLDPGRKNIDETIKIINEKLKKYTILFRGKRIDFKVIDEASDKKMDLITVINPSHVTNTEDLINKLIN